MAYKFVDEWVLLSYQMWPRLNNTFAETHIQIKHVSGIELNDINKIECEFLASIDFNLYVDQETYVCWVGLLEGLVITKERCIWQWWKLIQKSCQTPCLATIVRLVASLTVPFRGTSEKLHLTCSYFLSLLILLSCLRWFVLQVFNKSNKKLSKDR